MGAHVEKKKKRPLLRIIEFLIAVTFGVYIVPAAKHSLFPDQMTRFENMLRQAVMEGYNLAVDRKSESKIILTVFNGGQSLTVEIYEIALRELESTDDTRVFFAYAVNKDSNQVDYLTKTRIVTDKDIKRLKKLEAVVCGRLADQHAGVTRHDGYKPIYKCDVPEQQIECFAVEQEETSK